MHSRPPSASLPHVSPSHAESNEADEARPPSRLVALDALRGIAALIVVLHHAVTLFPQLFRRLHEASPALFALVLFISQRNVEAVWGFFVLSGFSIRLSIERRTLHGAGGLRRYFARRAQRILPLYWLALALSWLVARFVAPTPAEALSLETLLGNLLFLQTASGVAGQWFVPYAANGALWSLSFEAFFYLAYPALILLTGRAQGLAPRQRRIAYVIAASTLGHLLNLVIASPFSLFLSASFVWYAGVELAERWLGHPPTLSRPLVLAALAAAAVSRFAFGCLEFHGLVVGLFALLVGPFATFRGRGPEPASLSMFAWLGGVSYGLYLLHVPILRAVVAVTGQGSIGLVIAVLGAMFIAWAAEGLARRIVQRVMNDLRGPP